MPRNQEFDAAALRRCGDQKRSSFPSSFGGDRLAVPDERAANRDLDARDIRVSDTVAGMMIAAVSGAVVGFLTAGGVACAALVFVSAIVGAYAGWQARGGE
ncbi:hypothetical protein MSC49_29660 [Methylosinus sp. C49]|jgi:hypothetical protein|nr:hypothetical protein MSC49_29660 [Methylosinus sp. C49]